MRDYNKFFENIAEKNSVCFVDACFLLNPGFFEEFYPALERYNAVAGEAAITLNVLQSIMNELSSFVGKRANSEERARADKSQRILKILWEGIEQGKSFKLYKNSLTAKFNDPVCLAAVIYEGSTNNVHVFTNDRGLSADLCELMSYESIKILDKGITVSGYDRDMNFHTVNRSNTYRISKGGNYYE